MKTTIACLVAMGVGVVAALMALPTHGLGPFFGKNDNVILRQMSRLTGEWDDVAIFYGYPNDLEACTAFATEYVKRFYAVELSCLSRDGQMASGVINAEHIARAPGTDPIAPIRDLMNNLKR